MLGRLSEKISGNTGKWWEYDRYKRQATEIQPKNHICFGGEKSIIGTKAKSTETILTSKHIKGLHVFLDKSNEDTLQNLKIKPIHPSKNKAHKIYKHIL